MAKISIYSIIMEVLSIIFGAVLIIIGSVMYSPVEDGAFFYIIVVGGIVLALIGLTLFIVDMVRIQKQRKNKVETDETEIPLELDE
ncbi:MAG: hypothetical protein KGD59_00355 [Candidatus Heimdallarchaeota archaeon]|nr:hypothetical protein [Candidatus Heimdallarchaeota archaeon]MBY8992969.1 hypothetical protein [Candidatus Heimdallarchaeota archaeon]